MYSDLNPTQAKQFVDATQIYAAYRDAAQNAARYRGSMYWRTVKEHEYLIKQTDRIEKSLGPRTPETERIFKEFRLGKATTEDRKRSLSDALYETQAVNAALRVGRTPNVVVGVLNALRDAGIADHFLVIGTNALYAYETHAGVRFNGNITATADVDFLWDSRKHLTLVSRDDTFKEHGLIGLLRKVDPTFKVLDDEAYRAANDRGYMVDLIKRRPRSAFDDKEQTRLIPIAEDFWAARIRNMDWLLSSPRFQETVIGINGVMAEMPTVDPRAFVLFKLYLAEKDDRDPVKKPRDVEQAAAVFKLLQDRLPHLAFDKISVFPERIKEKLAGLFQAPDSPEAAARVRGLALISADLAGGRYAGEVIWSDVTSIVQHIGRGEAVLHKVSQLGITPEPGKILSVNYRDGKVQVSEKPKRVISPRSR